MSVTRRAMLGALGGLAVGGTVASVVGTGIAAAPENVSLAKIGRFEQVNGDFGWKPHKLDASICAPVAYDGYWHKGYGCGYGTFYSIIGMLGEQYGAPYNQFPFTLLEVNKGGISDWGTICGALFGAVAAFGLFWPRKERDPMVNELFRWYEETKLPIYNPGDAAQGVKGEIPSNASGSVLCHISVAKWCYTHDKKNASKERSERCGRITADVTIKAIEIINAKIDAGENWKGTYPKQAAVAYCGECHSKGKDSDIQKGNMDCTPCHSGGEHVQNKFKDHP